MKKLQAQLLNRKYVQLYLLLICDFVSEKEKTAMESLWVNKCDCDDAERNYYEKLVVRKSKKNSYDAETQVCCQLSAGTGYKLVR